MTATYKVVKFATDDIGFQGMSLLGDSVDRGTMLLDHRHKTLLEPLKAFGYVATSRNPSLRSPTSP